LILEKDSITPEIRNKLVKKGLSLIGMSDKEIIFRKSIRYFCYKIINVSVSGSMIQEVTNEPLALH
jgi:hypothetical protein